MPWSLVQVQYGPPSPYIKIIKTMPIDFFSLPFYLVSAGFAFYTVIAIAVSVVVRRPAPQYGSFREIKENVTLGMLLAALLISSVPLLNFTIMLMSIIFIIWNMVSALITAAYTGKILSKKPFAKRN